MNLMEDIARKLHIMLDKNFQILGAEGIYKLTNKGLVQSNATLVSEEPEIVLNKLLTGEYQVANIDRFKPSFGETYWYSDTVDVVRKVWVDDTIDLSLYVLGNVFKTRKEGRDSPIRTSLEIAYKSGRDLLKEAI